jgi:hypothetical protein
MEAKKSFAKRLQNSTKLSIAITRAHALGSKRVLQGDHNDRQIYNMVIASHHAIDSK